MNITVKLLKTIYNKNDFVISKWLRLNGKQKEYITCKGYNLPLNSTNWYIFTGDFENKDTFMVDRFEIAFLKSLSGLKSYFKSEEFEGLGKKFIDELVNKYGFEIFNLLDNNPNKIVLNSSTPQKMEILINGYRTITSLSEIKKILTPMGINPRYFKIINDAYGKDAVGIIKENPFKMAKTKGISFKTCDTIARYLNVGLKSKERTKYAIIEALNESAMSGDTFCNDKVLIENSLNKLNNAIDDDYVVSKKQVIDEIMELVNSHNIYVDEGHNFMSDVYRQAEENIAICLSALKRRSVQRIEKMLKTANKNQAKLSDKQLDAVKRSLNCSISVITGGAGTGKTTIVKSIIAAYVSAFPSSQITLLAPTGKAARRLSQSCGYEATTIHNRLKICDELEQPQLRINDGLVIVDEFSMVDTLLLSKLLMAINTSRCHVIFVGDIQQLQSVGAGACLKDIMESGVIPVSRLTETFRQDEGLIIDDATKVVKKDTSLQFDKTSMMLVKSSDEDDAINQIIKIYKYYVEKDGIENVAVICPLRRPYDKWKLVSDELNKILQKEINKSEDFLTYKEQTFKLNDRVMMTKNKEEASNGDVGTIVKLETDNPDWGYEITVVWENGNTAVYHKKDFEDLILAYCMSVHKSQGSEWKNVIIPLISSQKCKIMKNSLLYTSITRTKECCIIVNDNKSIIDYMVLNSDSNTRNTSLTKRIKKYIVD